MANIGRIQRIADPGRRAVEIGRVLNALPGIAAELRAMRQQAVLELRSHGFSYAEIGQRLGLHRNRVQQIAEGRSGGGKGGAMALWEWWAGLDPAGQAKLMNLSRADLLTPEEFESIRDYLPEGVAGPLEWTEVPGSRKYRLLREYAAFIREQAERRAARQRERLGDA